jgi:hypothetical protein
MEVKVALRIIYSTRRNRIIEDMPNDFFPDRLWGKGTIPKRLCKSS